MVEEMARNWLWQSTQMMWSTGPNRRPPGPRGFVTATPVQNGADPLDPDGIQTPPTPAEVNAIVTTIHRIDAGDTVGMKPHAYRNLPDPVTGAQLPPGNYTTYYIRAPGAAPGTSRLLVDGNTGMMYYTNNHYRSFVIVH